MEDVNQHLPYLPNRKQVVKVKHAVSESADVVSGVPQGSILGPLLFIIFMNDLALETENTELDMYADDSTPGASANAPVSLCQIIC